MNTTLSASSPALVSHPHEDTQYKVSAWPTAFGNWRWDAHLPKSTLPQGRMTHKGWGATFTHVQGCAPFVGGVGCASKEEALAAGHKFLAALLANEVGGFVDGWVMTHSTRC